MLTNEKTIMAFQAKGIRLQLIVKNNKIHLINNRKKVNLDAPYRKGWELESKIYHSIQDIIGHYYLNEIAYRIHNDGSFTTYKNDDL